MTRILVFFIVFSSTAFSQSISWTEITSSFSVPAGVRLYRGDRTSPSVVKLFYIDVDLNNAAIVVRPYLSSAASGKEAVAPFLQRIGGFAGVNGGYFGGSTSYSAIVLPGEVLAQNIGSVTRSPGVFPVARAFFGATARRVLSVDWIYHFGNSVGDVYRLISPLPNTQTTPAAPPTKANGTVYDSLVAGIGGGPMLVKNAQIRYTYTEEVFFGSGVDGELQNPRTAVGYTAQRHVIMLVADGRQAGSGGVTLPELAQIMLDLGCVGAMGLDGGGSTQMAARAPGGYSYVDSPSESRDVPTMLAVVPTDSLKIPPAGSFEKTIDTGDSLCLLSGGGWFASANQTWWGTTPSQLAPIGSGDKLARFHLALPRSMTCDLFAWWVASSNRAGNTPIIVKHKGGTDTVRVDQTQNGSRWYSIGRYTFSGDALDEVVISNAATTGSYVVADAIRLVSFDTPTQVAFASEAVAPLSYSLAPNYPNPFNPTTTIRFLTGSRGWVGIDVFDLLGRHIAMLVGGEYPPGTHSVQWDARGFSSGTYFCRMSVWPSPGPAPQNVERAEQDAVPIHGRDGHSGPFTQVRKIMLLR